LLCISSTTEKKAASPNDDMRVDFKAFAARFSKKPHRDVANKLLSAIFASRHVPMKEVMEDDVNPKSQSQSLRKRSTNKSGKKFKKNNNNKKTNNNNV